MFAKFFNMFKPKSNNKKAVKRTKYTSISATTKKKVDPARIGGLGEYKIDIQLSQLPKPSKYMNDLMLSNPKSRSGYSQIDHLLVTSYGIFVIETKNYSGTIKGGAQFKQWIVNGKFKMYNPLRQNYGHIQAVKSILSGYPSLKFISIVTFTMRCRLSVDPELRQIGSDELVIYDTELTDYIRRKLSRLKMEGLTPELDDTAIQDIVQLLNAANITDPSIRAQHINQVNEKK